VLVKNCGKFVEELFRVATTFSITFDEISSLVTGKHKKNTCKYADNKERYLEESNYRKAMLLHIIQQTSTGM
jgi:hypothetical protein